MEDVTQSPPAPDAAGRNGTPPASTVERDGSDHAGGGARRIMFQRVRRTPRRVRIAAVGYLVVAVFALGAGAALLTGADRTTALAVGLVLASPLVVALVGDRITGVKALSIEVSLSQVAVAVEGDFSGAVMNVAEMGPSGSPELIKTLTAAIKGHSRVVRLNLRDDDYWWSTRVYLVAALALDYTDVDAIVFVRAAEQRVFVGVSTPTAVRARLGARFPDYEAAYRKVRHEVMVSLARPAEDELQEILVWRWSGALAPSEAQTRVIVTTPLLKEWLGSDLDDDDLPYGPLSPLLRYRIATRPHRLAALTQASQLVAIVDRDELARRATIAELERRLT